MIKNKLTIYATDDFISGFRKLISLDLMNLKLLEKLFKKEYTFNFDEYLIEEYLKEAKVDFDSLATISAVIKYIHQFILENSISSKDLESEIEFLCKKFSIDIPNDKFITLTNLFSIPEEILESFSESPFLTGVIPNLVATNGIFDLRAIYDKTEPKALKSLKPIVIIQITSEDDDEYQKHFRFQTDIEGLDNFIRYLNEYKDKISELGKLSKQLLK